MRRLVVLHTDKDLPAARMAACRQGFYQLLDDSTHIASLLKARGYHPCGTIRGAPANSQRLRDFCGDAWMAVGDAAQAYDPLSSQGIDKALRTASHAGHMIHYALTDWIGVRLSTLLEETGIDPKAKWLLAEGADGPSMNL